MSPWPWTRPEVVRLVVRLVVTTVGTDGVSRRWYTDVPSGRRGQTIRIPAGTELVTIERPRRVRVYLGSARARR